MLANNIVRLNANGSYDSTFGTNGIVSLNNHGVTSVNVISADSIMVVTNNWINLSSTQLTAQTAETKIFYLKGDGSKDTQAVNGGEELVTPAAPDRIANFYVMFKGLSVTNYISGWEYTPNPPAGTSAKPTSLLARMLPNGRDQKFGTNGMATIDLTGQDSALQIHPFGYFTRGGRMFGLAFKPLSNDDNSATTFMPASIVRFN